LQKANRFEVIAQTINLKHKWNGNAPWQWPRECSMQTLQQPESS